MCTCNSEFSQFFPSRQILLHKSSYNSGNNILALFNNLAQVQIATSKTILDIYHNKLAARVASWVAERLKNWAFSPLGGLLCPHIKKKDLAS